ncbi:hypothetical protein [Pontiella sulfatireligans]|uniref:DUF4836 family protein n=1 Tax=Pontiella sulfatireligans TaxID=2750658 RepID=A0A6C2UMY5_9BACT|nr:hypothetical protein [Pontiella sulfatireligans]VGO20631.1 hypothetical protein SCARR_02696 [Pontiella sulfatireligans]
MKWIKTTCLAATISLSLTSVLQAAPAIEKPVVMPEAMLSVTVSDLHGLIDGVGSIAAQASPMMNGMMLKSMLGMQLGDPSLAGIAPGKGLAVVALDMTNAFVVIEVGEAQSAAYGAAVASKGMQSKYENGLLVIGKAPEQVAKGIALAGSVQKQLLVKRSPTLRVAAQPAAIVAKNGEQIQGMLQMMPMMMGAGLMQSPGMDTNTVANTTKILEGELRVLLSIASQCEVAELVLAPENGSLRISKTYAPKAGTRLAALMNAPQVNEPNPKIQAGLLGGGTMLLDCTMGNPDALAAFFVGETEQLVKEMKLKDIDMVGLLDNMKKWMGIYGGTFCESVGFGGDGGFSVNYLMEVKDEKAAMDLFRTMEKDMASFLKLYENLGMPMGMKFQENVREYKGVNIHQFTVNMDLASMPEEQRAPFETMGLSNMSYDLAIADGVMFYAMGTTKVEDLMDRVKDGSAVAQPLKARSVYPEGGFYYLDYDVASYMEFAASIMPAGPANPLTQMAATLKGASPLTSAGFKQDGLAMWSVNVPGDLIAKYGQMIMMMQMQQMQQMQQGGAPQGMPGAMPVQ